MSEKADYFLNIFCLTQFSLWVFFVTFLLQKSMFCCTVDGKHCAFVWILLSIWPPLPPPPIKLNVRLCFIKLRCGCSIWPGTYILALFGHFVTYKMSVYEEKWTFCLVSAISWKPRDRSWFPNTWSDHDMPNDDHKRVIIYSSFTTQIEGIYLRNHWGSNKIIFGGVCFLLVFSRNKNGHGHNFNRFLFFFPINTQHSKCFRITEWSQMLQFSFLTDSIRHTLA